MHGDLLPEANELRAALQKITSSQRFGRSKRSRDLLTYLVDETIEGRGDRLKAFSIAVEVFGRDETFDPDTDTLVRVQASRLRELLEGYYLTEGRDDDIEIKLAKGGYQPSFERRSSCPEHANVAQPSLGAGANTRVSRLRQGPIVIVAMAVSFAAIALFWFGSSLLNSEQGAGPNASLIDSALRDPIGPKIIVQPVIELFDDQSKRRKSLGLTVQLTHDLTRFRDLQVIAARASSGDLDKGAETEEASQQLAGHELIVTVWRDDTNVEVFAQLVTVADRRVAWSHVYRRAFSSQNIGVAFRSISADVAATLGSPGSPIKRVEAEGKPGSISSELSTHQCMLDFYDYAANKSSERHLRQRDCLAKVTRRSPKNARAWSMLAWIYGDEVRYRFNTKENAKKRSLDAAKEAVALDPTDAFTHHYLAESLLLDGNEQLAHHHFDRALSLNPNDTELLASVAWQRAFHEDWEAAKALAEKAIKLNPNHPNWYRVVPYMAYFRKGEYEKALAMVATRQAPNSPLGYLGRLAAHAKLEHRQQAKRLLGDLNREYPGFVANLSSELRRMRLPTSVVSQLAAVVKSIN